MINILDSINKTTDLLRYRSLHYEKLVGDKIGLESVRINDQYRVEFETRIDGGITVCNITELSNHYKKRENIVMGNLGYGAFPTHPGEVLKDEIEERGITQRQLAESMGLSYSVVNEILNARRPLTAKTALMFEAALDVPADSLMYLQTKYNLQTARRDTSLMSILKGIRKAAAVL